MQARVTGEYYRVLVESVGDDTSLGGSFDNIPDAIKAAMKLALDLGVSCRVQRVTLHEPVTISDIFGQAVIQTGMVTGEVEIYSPESYQYDRRLSRYHAVHGWSLPETIEVQTD